MGVHNTSARASRIQMACSSPLSALMLPNLQRTLILINYPSNKHHAIIGAHNAWSHVRVVGCFFLLKSLSQYVLSPLTLTHALLASGMSDDEHAAQTEATTPTDSSRANTPSTPTEPVSVINAGMLSLLSRSLRLLIY
jgi:hypothetical protein